MIEIKTDLSIPIDEIHLRNHKKTIAKIVGLKVEVQKPYFVAEISCNHEGNETNAYRLVDYAYSAGANAIKLQTFKPDEITIDCDKPPFILKDHPMRQGKTLYQLYQEAYTPWSWHKGLKDYAEELGMDFFSTPFHESAVEFLESLNVKRYKAASYMVENIPLLHCLGKTKKPVILSTGASTLTDIETAILELKSSGCPHITLMHCVSAYPTPIEDVHLRKLERLKRLPVEAIGLSDHSGKLGVAVGAYALGATVFEHHIKPMYCFHGLDSECSVYPDDLERIYDAVTDLSKAMGSTDIKIAPSEEKNLQFKTSIFAVKDISPDSIFTKENIKVIRPSDGLPPMQYCGILGKVAKVHIKRGEPLKAEHIK